MAGTCGWAICLVYALVDMEHPYVKKCENFFKPWQYMGMNAILVFFWHGTASTMLELFYVTESDNPNEAGAVKHTILSWFTEIVLN